MLQCTLSRENKASSLLCILHTAMSGGTTLQLTIFCAALRCAPLYLTAVGYNQLSAAMCSILFGDTIADSLLPPVSSTLIGDNTSNTTICYTALCLALSALYGPQFSIRWYKITTDYLLRCAPLHLERLELTLCYALLCSTVQHHNIFGTASQHIVWFAALRSTLFGEASTGYLLFLLYILYLLFAALYPVWRYYITTIYLPFHCVR
jgi:hypothetical protein